MFGQIFICILIFGYSLVTPKSIDNFNIKEKIENLRSQYGGSGSAQNQWNAVPSSGGSDSSVDNEQPWAIYENPWESQYKALGQNFQSGSEGSSQPLYGGANQGVNYQAQYSGDEQSVNNQEQGEYYQNLYAGGGSAQNQWNAVPSDGSDSPVDNEQPWAIYENPWESQYKALGQNFQSGSEGSSQALYGGANQAQYGASNSEVEGSGSSSDNQEQGINYQALYGGGDQGVNYQAQYGGDDQGINYQALYAEGDTRRKRNSDVNDQEAWVIYETPVESKFKALGQSFKPKSEVAAGTEEI